MQWENLYLSVILNKWTHFKYHLLCCTDLSFNTLTFKGVLIPWPDYFFSQTNQTWRKVNFVHLHWHGNNCGKQEKDAEIWRSCDILSARHNVAVWHLVWVIKIHLEKAEELEQGEGHICSLCNYIISLNLKYQWPCMVINR